GTCDVAETCSGTSAACPSDTLASNTVVCRPSGGTCDVAETCSGTSAACPSDTLASATVVCRASAGTCDVAETCSGTSAACPSDTLASNTVVCRASAGTCDVAETCSGTSAACPSDTLASNTVVCRASAGTCDVAETCSGTSATCPSDTLASNTVICRPSTGVCDPQESCTGASAACPANTLSSNTTICRASAGICDAPELCTGTSGLCPGDAFAPSSTVCRASAGLCDAAELCTGTAAACPADGFFSASTVCRASAGVCDPQETCTGTAAACPGDLRTPNGTICRASAGVCDVAETCNGTAVSCPADSFLANTNICRADADGAGCDRSESCTGSSAVCPVDGSEPAGTACTSGAQSGTCTAAGVCLASFGPDLTFASDGDAEGVTPSPGTSNARDSSNASALITVGAHAGKLIVVGNAAGSVDVGFVLRLNANGTPDTTFGPNGVLMFPNAGRSGTFDRFADVAITSTGQIVIVGDTFGNTNGDDLLVVRLNDTGAYDTTFGTQGRFTFNNVAGGNNLDRVAAVSLQSDGKIVIAGISRNVTPATNNKLFVGRLNTNGTIDTTFGGPTGDNATDPPGFVTDQLAGGAASSPADQIFDLAIDSSGRIYGAGFTRDAVNNNTPAVWRFTTTGRRDTTWDGDGRFVTGFTTGGDYESCVIDASNRLIAAGRPGNTSSLISRWNLSTGALDTSFDGDGHATYTFGSTTSTAIWRIGVQPDGRIVGGAYWGTPAFDNDLATFRVTTSGALDTTFSGDGFDVRSNLAGGNRGDTPSGIAITSAGEILNIGNSESVTNVTGFNDDTVVLRYTSAGVLDTTYGGGDGVYILGLTGFRQDIASDVALRSDGSLVAVGWTNVVGAGTSSENGALWAFNASGAPLASFNTSGTQFYDSTRRDQFFGVAADGNLTIAAGYSDRVGGGNDFALVRYTAAGGLDSSFCSTGSCLYSAATLGGGSATASAQAHDLVVRPTLGYAVAGFTATAASGNDVVVVGLTTTGALDAAFGTGGVFRHHGAANGNTVTNSSERAFAIARQTDGKLVVVGAGATGTTIAAGDDLVVYRLNTNGTLDTSFDGDGIAVTGAASPAGTRNDSGRAVAIQSDGRIVVAGYSSDGTGTSGNPRITVWRFTAAGALDTTFNGTGFFADPNSVSLLNVNEQRLGLAIDSSGRIYVTGTRFVAGTGFDLAIYRFTGGGVLDTSFDGDGVYTQHNAGGGDGRDFGHGLLIDGSNRLVISGQSRGTDTNDQDGIVWRFQ
ncbi:MAG: hypothetical protein GQE15_25410, partial [Archangiaceae bacterium]|nr:hypothetical protein [Archangiaceae bacterium]